VDRAGGSLGMQVGEMADVLIRDYDVFNALNLDGGGSTSWRWKSRLARECTGEPIFRPAGRPSRWKQPGHIRRA
jgi:exopolysaccharide biosynthesis protein